MACLSPKGDDWNAEEIDSVVCCRSGVRRAASAWADDVTGKWSGELNGPNGSMTLTASFKQDGTKLTGTIDGPGGEPMQIQDGKVDGDKIVFCGGIQRYEDCA